MIIHNIYMYICGEKRKKNIYFECHLSSRAVFYASYGAIFTYTHVHKT